MKTIIQTILICVSVACFSQKKQYKAPKISTYKAPKKSILKIVSTDLKKLKEQVFCYQTGKNAYNQSYENVELLKDSTSFEQKNIYLNRAFLSYKKYLSLKKDNEKLESLNDTVFVQKLSDELYKMGLNYYKMPHKPKSILYFKRYEEISGIYSPYLDTLLNKPKSNYISKQELRSNRVLDTKLLLKLVNDIRAKGCECGTKQMPPAHPLAWNTTLEKAAFNHSKDMWKFDYFSHTGKNGSQPWKRAQDIGYQSGYVGENIFWSSVPTTEAEAIQAWLESPGHCKNMMNSSYTEMGVSTYGFEYWTQMFGNGTPMRNLSVSK